jgi:hypothetical protein
MIVPSDDARYAAPARLRRPPWWLAFAAVAAGCTGTLPPQASPDEARAALVTALDAWKNGESAEALAGRQPPLYFNEPNCRAGVRLLGYTLSEGHESYGQSVRIAVVLSLKQADGSVRERKASYLIDTSPAVVIVPG